MTDQPLITAYAPYLRCDAPGCDHSEIVEAITEDLIGKPCPKCGANLLTKEDYQDGVNFRAVIDLLTSLTVEDAKQFAAAMGLPAHLIDPPEPEDQTATLLNFNHHQGTLTIGLQPLTEEP